MAINIGDNFSYQGKKYLDDRQSFKTLNELQNYKNVPEGFIAYCEENEKRYEYKNGTWSEYVVASSGGGGSISEDVATKEYVDGLIESHTHEEYDIKFDDVQVGPETNEERTALDFYANGEKVKTVYFTGGGGSGGGSPYISTELSENVLVQTGENLELTIDYYAPSGGKGTLKVFINNVDSMTTSVEDGTNTVTISPDKLTKGTNQVVVYAIDRAGMMSNSLTFYVRYGSTDFTSDFDSSTPYDYGSTIRYYFTPTALDTSAALTFYMKINGAVQPGVECKSDTRSYFTFSNNITAGGHDCECWVEDASGNKSEVKKFTLVVLDTNTLVVVSKTHSVTLEEGSQLSLDYRVYKKNETTFKVKTYINDNLVTSGTCGTSTTYYKTTSLQKGVYTIRIEAWDITETYSDFVSWTVTVTPSTYTMLTPIKAGSIFSATAQNRTNGDNNREVLVGYDQDDKVVNAQLHNFSFNNESGWIDDQLLITGNSYVEIPVQPLASNARYGFTLDVEFSAKPVGADDAEVLSLWNEVDSCGIKITQEQLIMQSKSGNRCELYFTEDQTVSAIFVIDRSEKTAKIYLNGVMCSAFALSDYVIDDVSYLEDFTVIDNIYLGGKNTNGYSRIKNIRVYEIALTSSEILDNFMSNEKDKTKQIELVNFQKGEDLPTVTVYCDFSGLGKDDKKYCDIIYNSPDPSKYGESFALMGKHSQLQYQGTSSMQYPIKNYRLNPKDADGKVKIKLPFCQPESRFTLKADFMSSGHWQNTGLTKWINNNLYDYDENDEKSMNPAKWWALQNGKNPDDYRECIYGFPCRLILVNDGSSPLNEGQQEPTPGNTKDMGVFNFNLDKDCENSLGFKIPDFPNAVSMEVTANSDTSAGAFMSKDLPDAEQLAYLQESFELRYGNEDVDGWGFLGMEVDGVWSTEHSLKALVDWVDNSTDEEFVSEFEEHFHKDYTLRYYLLVIILGMVDNLGKNMMLDSYDGKLWMPRFYDCDTICSYDNSGAIKFDVDIEMEQGYWNTSSSRLWTRVRDLFHDELIAKYNQMRQKGLSYESLMSVFYDEQIAKIPQKYYNLDADVKYLPYADEYLGKAHGDGYEHLKRWLKNRIMFVDTLFDYTPSYTNDMITFRANTTELMSITIETYSPVYQHLSWYNGNMEKGKISRGTKFTFRGYAQAATDQEILVYGGSNIKRITGISSMNPDSMLIGNATRLVELDVSGSPLLTDINSNKANLTAHTYLTKLDISDCPNLAGSLRLNFSPLIREINAMNTGITDLQLPSSIRNLKSLKVPGALTNLTLNDASSLETLEFDGANQLQIVSMTNCNALKNVVNFDMTQVPNVTLNNSYDVEELYMSKTTNLSLINMANIQRLVYLPNSEYENFNLTTLRNSSNYTISAVNCPSLKTFITTAPQRKSYKLDTLTHDIRPDMTFSANILDISNTKITDVKFYCTTDVYQLRLPATLNNFVCDSTFDIDMKHVTEADFDFIHHDLIEAYTNPDNYFRYHDSISYDIIPTSSDGSLIFSMYVPELNNAEPDLYEWNLYGLKFEEFYTYAMNNNIMSSGNQITMASRYANYGITIDNANIEPTRYPTMLYPTLVNEKSPIIGKIDYKYYVGDDLSYAMAYANKNEVDIDIPTSVIINASYVYNIDYESEYTYFHPNTVAVYTSLKSGVLPTFNSQFTRYTVSEVLNSDGSYTTTIGANITGDSPTWINFANEHAQANLYRVEYINTTRLTSVSDMFLGCSQLTSIDLSGWDTSKITSMQQMFNGCSALTSLDLSGWDTSMVNSMYGMFFGCSSLTSLDLSGFKTSSVTTMSGMFADCSRLSSLDVTGFDTSKVTDTGNMFVGCSSLTSLDVSSFDTSKVTTMYNMFNGCSALTSLDVSNFDTSLVIIMNNTFNDCSGLTTLDLSGWDTSNVTDMNSMFNGCTGLISLDVSNFDTSLVTNMTGIFSACSSLASIDLSNFDTSSVTNMSNMFSNCSRLSSLDVTGFDTSKVTDMSSMFKGCSRLTSLDLSNFDTPKLNYAGDMFYSCSSLTSLKWTNWLRSVTIADTKLTSECIKDLVNNLGKVDSEQTLTLNATLAGYLTRSGIIGADVKNWILTNINPIEFINILSTDNLASGNSTTKICAIELTESNKYTRFDEVVNAYTACNEVYIYDDGSVTSLEHLFTGHNTESKNKITSLGVICGYFINNTSTRSMFNDCFELTTLDLSGFDTSRVNSMSEMFRNCTKLTSLDLTNFNTSEVTNMGNMFQYCTKLTSLDLSGWDTSKVTNMSNMFDKCSSLTSLDVSGWDTSMVNSMYGMFFTCAKLTSLDLSGFETSKVADMNNMFNGCSGLTSLDVSNFDTSMVTNMSNMFTNCHKLTSLDLSGWDTSMVNSMYGMFASCSALTSLDLSNFDTSKVDDMTNMFNNCTALTSLDLSGFDTSKVDNMDSMFNKCHSLTSLKWTNWLKSVSVSDTKLTSECIRELVNNLGKVNVPNELTLNSTLSGYLEAKHAITADIKNWIITPSPSSKQYQIIPASLDLSSVSDSTVNLCVIELTESNKYTRFDEMVNAYTACNEVYIYDDGSITSLADLFVGHNTESNNKITSLGVIGGYFINNTSTYRMFYGCYRLTSLDVSGFDTSSVTTTTSMFDGCSGLTTLDVSSFDTSNVENMNSMFSGCTGLTSLDVSGFDTSKVTSMSNMFNGCSELTSLDLSGWDISSVNNMGAMFYNCHRLTSLDVSGFKTSLVTTMSNMFYNCYSLKTIDVSDWDTSSVVFMNCMFQGCSGLTSLDVSGFDTSKVDNMSHMFNGCSSLTSLDVSGFDTSNVNNMSNMFNNCRGLTSLDVSGFKTSLVGNMGAMFNKCSGLTSLDVRGFDTSRVGDMTNMFNGCSALTSLDLSSFNTSMVASMAYMFNGCSGLTSLDISSFNTSSAGDMSHMFNGCSGLTSLDMSRFITSNVKYLSHMFRNCSALTSLDLTRFDTSKVEGSIDIFYGCVNLETIKWTNWKPSVDVSSTSLTPESTKDIVSKLAVVTESKTLTLGYTILSYLTEDEIIAATNKGWSLVG